MKKNGTIQMSFKDLQEKVALGEWFESVKFTVVGAELVGFQSNYTDEALSVLVPTTGTMEGLNKWAERPREMPLYTLDRMSHREVRTFWKEMADQAADDLEREF